jgi:G:T/U-mismatch repair DNA glycosylase
MFLKKHKNRLSWGEQKEVCGKTKIWILPSTSGLNGGWDKNNYKKIWKNLYQYIK